MKALLTLAATFIMALSSAFGQLKGRITDEKGEPLPFANVVIDGTTRGTTANTEGYYALELEPGNYRVVFQYIGYKRRIESVNLSGAQTLNVKLEPSTLELNEVVIKSNAEDPAYPIIRKAIEMRKTYLTQVSEYTCDVYIKGLQKLVNAPKKILGQDLGDMDGNIDTLTRSGIVYLSETVSKLYVKGDEKKEELISSKVSGNNNGFGFNRATLFDFNLYENYNSDLQRKFLSPIAETALQYYKYHLVASIRDEEKGLFVHKIEVIPVRKEDPTWAGFIYIVDNQWNIYASELYATGKKMQVDIVDTIHLNQTYLPVGDKWRIFSQTVDFKLKILGLTIKGFFNGVFSNYNLTPQYARKFFNNEVFNAANAKKENNLSEWEKLRPIPLTEEEKRDYIRKDSIAQVRRSKTYIDSVYRKSNKFEAMNLLTGYTYQNPYKRTSLGFESLLNTVTFNAVQGLSLNLNTEFTKRFADSLFGPVRQRLTIRPSVNYGFAENRARPELKFTYQFNRFNDAELNISGGQKIEQFNPLSPITAFWAMQDALFEKRHAYFIYDKTYGKIAYSREISNGFNATISSEYAVRAPLSINTQYSFRKKEEQYNNNVPNNPLAQNFQRNHAFISTIDLQWTPKLRYVTYPHYKDREAPRYPVFNLKYQKAIPFDDLDADFDRLDLRVIQNSLPMGLVGYSELAVEYGAFLNKTRVGFMDANHFNGNDIRVIQPLNYMRGFYRLPFYEFSTTNNYFMAHWQHHFESFIFDKIPLVRKLGFGELIRVAYLNTPTLGNYVEFGFGIDQIGWGLFRMFRFDLVWNYRDGAVGKPIGMIGINAPFAN